ncbi:MAG: hypothetical protein NXY57DRAFT_597058 [Lentinula lateritia]|nr:MAG: hypothetical protein NXY57DRAFT_597058 [Lentinula lateritia]
MSRGIVKIALKILNFLPVFLTIITASRALLSFFAQTPVPELHLRPLGQPIDTQSTLSRTGIEPSEAYVKSFRGPVPPTCPNSVHRTHIYTRAYPPHPESCNCLIIDIVWSRVSLHSSDALSICRTS